MRRNKNRILLLHYDNGESMVDQELMKDLMVFHFNILYSNPTNVPTPFSVRDCFPVLDVEVIVSLQNVVTSEEIK